MAREGDEFMSVKALEFLKSKAAEREGVLTASLSACREAARIGGISALEAEILALENDICPSRYEKNLGTIGLEGQAKLLKSHAAVVGCGGLGGWIIELLARAGVGMLTLFDGDVFDESNLNRQLFANEENIGRAKAEAAAARVKTVNGAVSVRAYSQRLNGSNALKLLRGCDLVLDALDNNSSRRETFSACRELGIPFVHGAIGGFFAQVGVFYPLDRPLWAEEGVSDGGAELTAGNPPFTPSFAASLQAAEAVKLLAGLSGQLRGSLLWFDIKRYDVQNIKIGEAG